MNDHTDTALDLDLSGMPSRALEPRPERKPKIAEAPHGGTRNKGALTITTEEPIPEGGDWTETLQGEGEVLIVIGDHVPTSGERRLVARFGPTQPADEPIRLPSLEHLRGLLRDMIWDAREEAAQAERIERWNALNVVLDVIERKPGITTTELVDGVREVLGGRDDQVRRLRNALLDDGLIVTTDGPRRAVYHFLGDPEAVAHMRLNRNAAPEEVGEL